VESELKVRRLLWWRKTKRTPGEIHAMHSYDPSAAVRITLLGKLSFEKRDTKSARVTLLRADVSDLYDSVPAQYRLLPALSTTVEWLEWVVAVPMQIVRDSVLATMASYDPKQKLGQCALCAAECSREHTVLIITVVRSTGYSMLLRKQRRQRRRGRIGPTMRQATKKQKSVVALICLKVWPLRRQYRGAPLEAGFV
jgi:hypothetical protein